MTGTDLDFAIDPVARISPFFTTTLFPPFAGLVLFTEIPLADPLLSVDDVLVTSGGLACLEVGPPVTAVGFAPFFSAGFFCAQLEGGGFFSGLAGNVLMPAFFFFVGVGAVDIGGEPTFFFAVEGE